MNLKSILLGILMVFAGVSALAQNTVVKHEARLRVCNPIQQSYCHQSKLYGEGFGMIEFLGVPKRTWPVRGGGKTLVDASIMTGRLQAFLTLEYRANRDKKWFISTPFKVSGYWGKSPVTDTTIVFYVTDFVVE